MDKIITDWIRHNLEYPPCRRHPWYIHLVIAVHGTRLLYIPLSSPLPIIVIIAPMQATRHESDPLKLSRSSLPCMTEPTPNYHCSDAT